MKAQAISTPDIAREACALNVINYEDAFALHVPYATAHTAEDWAHEIFANALLAARTIIGQSWNVLGFKTRPETQWQSLLSGIVIKKDAVFVTVVHSELIGISICIVISVDESQVVMSSFFQRASKKISSIAWHMMAPTHRLLAPYLLMTAAKRMGEKSSRSSQG